MINSKQAELSKLQQTRQYLTLWDKILAPRSQAWSDDGFLSGASSRRAGSDLRTLEVRDQAGRLQTRRRQPKTVRLDFFANGVSRDPAQSRAVFVWSDYEKDRRSQLSSLQRPSGWMTLALRFPTIESSKSNCAKRQIHNSTAENKPGVLAYVFRLVVTQTFAGGDSLAIPVLPKPKNIEQRPDDE